MSPIEEAVDAAIHATLRAAPLPAVRAMYARLIEAGTIDWATLERTLRSSAAFAARQASADDRDAVTDLVRDATGSAVIGGPFAGMRLLDRSSRGDGDLAPKLLGTYERELHPAIAACATRRYDAVVDVGAAEGYYAVGLARLLAGVPVFAFDPDPVARDVLARHAALNGCGDRIVAAGACDPAALAALLRRHPRALVVCDCEGDEATLIADGAVVAAGRRADLLIECHDHWDATITPTLLAALSPSHAVARIDQGGRDPHAFPFLAALDEWGRWRAVWERRGPAQHWLFCEARHVD